MSSHLFRFQDINAGGMGPSTYGTGTGGAPKLSHIGETSDGTAKKNKGETYVDVIHDFPWTNSPTRAREDSPYIDLVESRILQNPMLNQIATHLAVLDNVGSSGDTSESQRDSIRQSFTEQTESLEGGFGIMEAVKTVGKGMATPFTTADGPLYNYKNLYTTDHTGWRYRLPYYTDNYKQLMNSFTDQSGQTGGGIGGKLLDVGLDGANIAAQVGQAAGGTFLGPGQYIETSKFFSFGGREKSYQFNFPLSNTSFTSDSSTQMDVITKNWELLYLLVYQNTPNRLTRDLVIPPCIYEAKVPGTLYAQYAYISGIQIDFIGTRRMMELNVPQYPNGFKSIKAIIPDVYGVTITVTELHGESQNMMAHMINSDSIITTG